METVDVPTYHDPRSLIVDCYAMPFRRASDVARAFWPHLALAGVSIVYFADAAVLDFAGFISSPLLIAAIVYLCLQSARGAIIWHRGLVLDEPISITPPWPSVRSIRYIGWGLLIGLFAMFIGFFPGFIIGFMAVVMPDMAGQFFLQASGHSVSAFLTTSLIGYAIYAIILYWIAEVSLSLPRASVADGPGSPLYRHLSWFGPSDRSIAFVVLATYIPIAFATDVLAALLAMAGMADGTINLVSYLGYLYLGIVSLTALSLLYGVVASQALAPSTDENAE